MLSLQTLSVMAHDMSVERSASPPLKRPLIPPNLVAPRVLIDRGHQPRYTIYGRALNHTATTMTIVHRHPRTCLLCSSRLTHLLSTTFFSFLRSVPFGTTTANNNNGIRAASSAGVMRYRTRHGWISEHNRSTGRQPILEILSVGLAVRGTMSWWFSGGGRLGEPGGRDCVEMALLYISYVGVGEFDFRADDHFFF